MTLGKLLEFIKENTSPSIQKRLTKFVDNKIRNSLAHGTYWYKEAGQKVCLAKNSYLDKVEEMPLQYFLTEIIKLGIISHAFSDVLIKKCEAGYFKQ